MTKLRIHFAGVGGQGTQTASRILGEAALRADVPVLVAALHGMAQRGGAVSNQVIMGGVHSPVIEPGEADVFLGFEPIEAARYAALARPGAEVIVSTSPIVPYALTAAGGTYPELDKLLSPLRKLASKMHVLDAAAVLLAERRERVTVGDVAFTREKPSSFAKENGSLADHR